MGSKMVESKISKDREKLLEILRNFKTAKGVGTIYSHLKHARPRRLYHLLDKIGDEIVKIEREISMRGSLEEVSELKDAQFYAGLADTLSGLGIQKGPGTVFVSRLYEMAMCEYERYGFIAEAKKTALKLGDANQAKVYESLEKLLGLNPDRK